jgi:hypothetical protein
MLLSHSDFVRLWLWFPKQNRKDSRKEATEEVSKSGGKGMAIEGREKQQCLGE